MPEHNYQEQDFFPDEQAIEISDLPEDDHVLKAQNSPTANVRKNIRKISLGTRYTPQQRRRRAIISGSITLLVLIVFLISVFPVQTLVKQFITPDSKHLLSGE